MAFSQSVQKIFIYLVETLLIAGNGFSAKTSLHQLSPFYSFQKSEYDFCRHSIFLRLLMQGLQFSEVCYQTTGPLTISEKNLIESRA